MPFTGDPGKDLAELRTSNPDMGEDQLMAGYLHYAAQKGQTLPAGTGMTTPARELGAMNQPIQKGLEAGSEAVGSGPLGIGTLGAPGAAAGSFAGTIAHGALSSIPGLGGPSGVIPAAGAAAVHAGAQTLTDIGTGKLLGSAFSAIGGAFKASPTRAEQVENAISKFTGQSTDPVVRKEVLGRLYQQAEQQGGVIKPTEIVDSLNTAIKNVSESGSISNAAKKQLLGSLKDGEYSGGTLTNMRDKYLSNPKGGTASYWIKEEQQLAQQARDLSSGTNPDSTSAKLLNQQRQSIIDVIDKTSPALKTANEVAFRQKYADDLIEMLHGPKPTDKLSVMLKTDPAAQKAFGLSTPKDVTDMITQVKQLEMTKDPAEKAKQFAKWAGGVFGGGMAAYMVHRYLGGLIFRGGH